MCDYICKRTNVIYQKNIPFQNPIAHRHDKMSKENVRKETEGPIGKY